MAGTMSETLDRRVRYRQVLIANYRATMQQCGASTVMAPGAAEKVKAPNDGVYDAEPHGPDAVGATSFGRWCLDVHRRPDVRPDAGSGPRSRCAPPLRCPGDPL